MKKYRNLIIIAIIIVVAIAISIGLYLLLSDKNKLTVSERNWINENINNVQNINIINNANVFGKNGEGVFYSFLEDVEDEYDLKFNPITFNYSSNPSGVTFGLKNTIKK